MPQQTLEINRLLKAIKLARAWEAAHNVLETMHDLTPAETTRPIWNLLAEMACIAEPSDVTIAEATILINEFID